MCLIPGIELDVRRYVTALLAALHLAKVTSQQQQQELALANAPQPTPASPASPPSANGRADADRVQPTRFPTTAQEVKTTPEAKSDGAGESGDQ